MDSPSPVTPHQARSSRHEPQVNPPKLRPKRPNALSVRTPNRRSGRMLTDASGKATATFSYGAYGKETGSTGTQTTPLGYAGQYTNTQSGLQYLRARVYDPATGQFLTRDPLEDSARSPYLYAAGNPLTYTDPSGLMRIRLGQAACLSAVISP